MILVNNTRRPTPQLIPTIEISTDSLDPIRPVPYCADGHDWQLLTLGTGEYPKNSRNRIIATCQGSSVVDPVDLDRRIEPLPGFSMTINGRVL